MKSVPTIVEFVHDRQLLNLSLSSAQEVLLRAVYGLPLLTSEHRDIWELCTGGRPYREGHQFAEVTCISGARGGKDSRILAPIICFEACFGRHEQYLHRGERAMVPLVAQDARATAISRDYVFSYFRASPLLRTLIADERQNELVLTNRMTIACFPCTKSSLRGWSNPVAGLNELAFWRLEGSADSDAEVQASVRRGMLSFPRTKLIKISTPYTRSGVLYADYQRGFGHDDPDLLVWRAPSALMNPSITEARLDRERRLDPIRFAREYEAEFTDDLASAFELTTVQACVDSGVREREPVRGVHYVAFCDAAAGEKKGNDRFSLGIAHRVADGVVLDLVRWWSPPFNPGSVIAEIAALLGRYHVSSIAGDKYAPGFVAGQFRSHGIRYEAA